MKAARWRETGWERERIDERASGCRILPPFSLPSYTPHHTTAGPRTSSSAVMVIVRSTTTCQLRTNPRPHDMPVGRTSPRKVAETRAVRRRRPAWQRDRTLAS